ncbi:MAG: hypothetical protein FWH07_03570 [Oscillospiraceae bacterium]|nr:hypothetical protein [Oscillospiraceae bacterium]
MKIIKSNTYNVVSTDPFDIPLPLEFELMSGNSLLASYSIHEDGQVDYSFNPTAKDRILTSTARRLELNDIYFLFSSRVFQDKTPFTEGELRRFGIEDYNPYEVLRKTHGIMPIDRYWFKFSDEEDLTYKKAAKNFADYFKPPEMPESSNESAETDNTEQNDDMDAIYSIDSILEQKSHEYSSIHDVGSILNENKIDVESLASNIDDEPITESAFAPVLNNTKKTADSEPESSGGNMSPEAIAALLAGSAAESEPEPEPKSSGGNMSPEAIAALLAGSATESEPKSSGGNMSPETIAALLEKES